MDTLMLKAAIVSSGKRSKDVASDMKLSLSAFSAKLNGHRDFTLKEAALLCRILGIDSAEDKDKIFFTR